MTKAYLLKFNNGADFWRVYNGDTGFCISEHNSKNAARKKVKRLNKRIELEEKRERMKEDLAFFIECVHGRKIDPSMIKYSNPMSIEAPIPWSGEEEKAAKANDDYWKNVLGAQTNPRSLGNCEQAAIPIPCVSPSWCMDGSALQEKGNNPMRIENTTATAYVTAAKSDDATSRDYLLSRLESYQGWRSPKLMELSKLFNLGEDGRPQTYQQLIDAIKNDKFSLDKKAVARLKRLQDEHDEAGEDFDAEDYGYGPFYGITFEDFPKADRKGYDAAVAELEALIKATKDTIMVKSPAEGLTALQTLEAWTPTGKAS